MDQKYGRNNIIYGPEKLPPNIKYHFVNIHTSVEMIIIAELFLREGVAVSASASLLNKGFSTRRLSVLGAAIVFSEEDPDHIRLKREVIDATSIVYSPDTSADSDPEIIWAKNNWPGKLKTLDDLIQKVAEHYPEVPEVHLFEAIKAYLGRMEHSKELVAEINGVLYYNDSWATSITETRKTLKELNGSNIILIGGGYVPPITESWIQELNSLIEEMKPKVKHVFLMGSAKEWIGGLFEKASMTNYTICNDLAACLHAAKVMAAPGDTVILSPFCASFDQYEGGYKERGLDFRELVKGMKV